MNQEYHSLAAIAGSIGEVSAVTLVAGPGIDSADDRKEVPSILERIVLLRDDLTNRFGGRHSVWWVRNYQIGKNPYFSGALIEIARRRPEQRMIFHIRDFPECALRKSCIPQSHHFR